MFWPCETRTSTCLSFATISSGLYRFLAIAVLLDVKDIPQVGPLQWGWITRARQNVIGEMFWFAGKLGRQRVCALKKGDVEMPSDFVNVVYTEMDDRGAWKSELLRELDAAGYEVDWRKALG